MENLCYSFRAHAGKDSDWYRNLEAHTENTQLRISFKKYNPRVEFIEDPSSLVEIMRWYVKKYPRSSTMIFGWDPKRDNPETTDITSLIETIKIVRLGPR